MEAAFKKVVDEMKVMFADEMRAMHAKLDLLTDRSVVKEHYSTEEFGRLMGMKPKTIRDYCNEGRLNGVKHGSGHGCSNTWAVPHAEKLRYERDGLLPRVNSRPTD